jgi:hypothetical protein
MKPHPYCRPAIHRSQSAHSSRIFFAILLLCSGCCKQDKIPHYIAKLQSREHRDRSSAAFELARCGEKAGGAVSILSRLLYDDNAGVQSAAAYALREIDTPAAREILAKIKRVREEQRKSH